MKMKNLNRITKLTCWLFISFLFFQTTESKAQVIKMSAKDLTVKSTAVLYGKCSKVKCEWNDKKDKIYTYVTIVPEAYIKGNLGSEVTVTVPGGQVGDIVYEVSDMPFFVEGEETVAFVWKNLAGKNLITGGYQGKMKIEKDSKTGKRMVSGTGIEEVETGVQAPGQVKKAEKMQLEDFVTKVKGYLKN
jgi:hypothetical protein